MLHTILAIPALNDNYIWTIVHPSKRTAIVIDPGDSKPILKVLEQKGLTLTAILLTHHHWDHTNGIFSLLNKYPVLVYGPCEHIPLCNHHVKDGDQISLQSTDLSFTVLSVPGHTLGHVAYYGHQSIFTGDTLFAGGCGRLFEGSPTQLYNSLLKLTALPSNTRLYCGHEYTKKNLEFAHVVEPNNITLKKRIIETQQVLDKKLPTLPSNLKLELDTNPFLRCHEKSIQQSVEQHYGCYFKDPISVFQALRKWKDEF